MNIQHPATAITENRERYSYARLHGRWLLLARGLWITLVILTLTIFFASLPTYMAQLQTPCVGAACIYQQLTPGQVETLTGMGLSPADYAAFTIVLALVCMLVCLVVSALIILRRSDDQMAFIVALMLVVLGPIIIAGDISISSPWLVPNECLTFLFVALLMLVFSLFPTGQFVPRWMRWVLIIFLVVQAPVTFFQTAPLISDTPTGQLGWLVTLLQMTILVLVQLYRYWRVFSPLQRQQTKWVIFGLAVPITGYIVISVLTLFFPVLSEPGSLYPLVFNEAGFLLPLCLPLAFGFAMLRYQLWEIDTLINRTLVYGALTVILTGLYAGLIIGLQTLLRGIISQNSIAIVISTLAIAALFQPLRRRIQRFIDRRFYRRKYDAAKTLAAFSTTLRNKVDLSGLSEQLVAVVEDTMQPSHISLWLSQSQRRERDSH